MYKTSNAKKIFLRIISGLFDILFQLLWFQSKTNSTSVFSRRYCCLQKTTRRFRKHQATNASLTWFPHEAASFSMGLKKNVKKRFQSCSSNLHNTNTIIWLRLLSQYTACFQISAIVCLNTKVLLMSKIRHTTHSGLAIIWFLCGKAKQQALKFFGHFIYEINSDQRFTALIRHQWNWALYAIFWTCYKQEKSRNFTEGLSCLKIFQMPLEICCNIFGSFSSCIFWLMSVANCYLSFDGVRMSDVCSVISVYIQKQNWKIHQHSNTVQILREHYHYYNYKKNW